MARSVAGGEPDIWVRNLESGNMTRLTFNSAQGVPVWSPDGRQVVFASDRDGVGQIYRKDASGAGAEERLTDGPNPKAPRHISRDGRYLLYTERKPEGDQDLWVLPLEGGAPGARQPIAFAQTRFMEANGEISPDGRWIAYSSDEFRRPEIFVRPAPWVTGATDGRWQVSNGGGSEPKWRADGGEIYYRQLFDFMAAAVNKSTPGFQTREPRKLFTATTIQALNVFDVTQDGRKFALIMRPSDTNNDPLTVVTNWQAKLLK
jgi:Tol biopolymer transport system component